MSTNSDGVDVATRVEELAADLKEQIEDVKKEIARSKTPKITQRMPAAQLEAVQTEQHAILHDLEHILATLKEKEGHWTHPELDQLEEDFLAVDQREEAVDDAMHSLPSTPPANGPAPPAHNSALNSRAGTQSQAPEDVLGPAGVEATPSVVSGPTIASKDPVSPNPMPEGEQAQGHQPSVVHAQGQEQGLPVPGTQARVHPVAQANGQGQRPETGSFVGGPPPVPVPEGASEARRLEVPVNSEKGLQDSLLKFQQQLDNMDLDSSTDTVPQVVSEIHPSDLRQDIRLSDEVPQTPGSSSSAVPQAALASEGIAAPEPDAVSPGPAPGHAPDQSPASGDALPPPPQAGPPAATRADPHSPPDADGLPLDGAAEVDVGPADLPEGPMFADGAWPLEVVPQGTADPDPPAAPESRALPQSLPQGQCVEAEAVHTGGAGHTQPQAGAQEQQSGRSEDASVPSQALAAAAAGEGQAPMAGSVAESERPMQEPPPLQPQSEAPRDQRLPQEVPAPDAALPPEVPAPPVPPEPQHPPPAPAHPPPESQERHVSEQHQVSQPQPAPPPPPEPESQPPPKQQPQPRLQQQALQTEPPPQPQPQQPSESPQILPDSCHTQPHLPPQPHSRLQPQIQMQPEPEPHPHAQPQPQAQPQHPAQPLHEPEPTPQPQPQARPEHVDGPSSPSSRDAGPDAAPHHSVPSGPTDRSDPPGPAGLPDTDSAPQDTDSAPAGLADTGASLEAPSAPLPPGPQPSGYSHALFAHGLFGPYPLAGLPPGGPAGAVAPAGLPLGPGPVPPLGFLPPPVLFAGVPYVPAPAPHTPPSPILPLAPAEHTDPPPPPDDHRPDSRPQPQDVGLPEGEPISAARATPPPHAPHPAALLPQPGMPLVTLPPAYPPAPQPLGAGFPPAPFLPAWHPWAPQGQSATPTASAATQTPETPRTPSDAPPSPTPAAAVPATKAPPPLRDSSAVNEPGARSDRESDLDQREAALRAREVQFEQLLTLWHRSSQGDFLRVLQQLRGGAGPEEPPATGPGPAAPAPATALPLPRQKRASTGVSSRAAVALPRAAPRQELMDAAQRALACHMVTTEMGVPLAALRLRRSMALEPYRARPVRRRKARPVPKLRAADACDRTPSVAELSSAVQSPSCAPWSMHRQPPFG